jgi:ribosome biogenesis GTPase A
VIIDWFPGHMATARREAGITMRATDVVIEVLDARAPGASCSPLVEELRRENQRPALKVLNKIDLADPERTKAWLAHYNSLPKTKAIALAASDGRAVAGVPRAALTLAPTRVTTLKPLRLMILGIPNVGKSTLMNTLLRRRVAKVGDEPAITKQQNKYALSPTSWIVDTPGMLWPKVDQEVAWKLAATHSIGRNAYDDETVALRLATTLLADYPAPLSARYGALPASCDNHGLLNHIAQVRSMAKDGLAQASVTLLQDFRTGKLGRVTLEAPPVPPLSVDAASGP